ncbi:MAG: ankyrin repeat domain-containing protein [Alphaproteobacteria bacterium]|nr:ankyrin repeat domain-containing protein [Alphaproteobacteria bacterium]MBR1757056.1 ankyrin repeat domain-containing protein [Alphaproteobacteria bacterium]
MSKSSTSPISQIVVRIKELKAKKAERQRVGELTKQLINIVKNPDKDAAKKITELVKKGADVNNFDMDKERSLLHIAAEQNRMDVVKALVENGCKSYINVNDVYGKDPAFYAIDNNNAEMLDYLLAHGISTKRPADFNLMSSYRYAVLSGNTELVKIELKHGADVNDYVGQQFVLYDRYEKTYPGPTPLADLVLGKDCYDPLSTRQNSKIYDEAMIKLLLDNGARTDLADPYGNTAHDSEMPEHIRKMLNAQQQKQNAVPQNILRQAKIKSM